MQKENVKQAVVRALLAVASLTAAAVQVQAGLIVNGSFESDGLAGWHLFTPVEVRTDEGATDGTHAAVFNYGNSAPGGYLYQDVTTVIGQAYTLTFDYGGFGVDNTMALQAQVISNPATFDQLSLLNPILNDQGTTPTTFSSYTMNFTATATTTRIGFADATGFSSSFNADPVLDNVDLTADVATPEPGGLALSALGLGCMAGFLHHRRAGARNAA